MKSTKYIFLILIFTLLNATICLIVLKHERSTNQKNGIEMATNHRLETLYHKTELSFEAIKFNIDLDAKVVNMNNDTLLLIELINSQPKLIFRFTHLTCGSCVRAELNSVNYVLNENSQNDVIVLTHFTDMRDFLIFLTKSRYRYQIYNTVDYEIIPGFKNNNDPYYFIVEHNYSPKYFYFPDTEFSDLSKIFVETAIEYISDITK